MFKNYIIVTIRNLLRHKVNSLINIGGLAIGIACCILIFLYVKDELTYDTFHEKADTIFAVRMKSQLGSTSCFCGPLGPALQTDFPEVTSFIRVWPGQSLVRYEEKIFQEKIIYSDSNFFSFFTFPLENGSPKTVLQNPNSIVITKQVADKYFGNEDPLGKTIALNLGEKFEDFIIMGIAKEAPNNSSIKFDFVVSINKSRIFKPTDWGTYCVETFIRLTSKNKASELNNKLPLFINKYLVEKYHASHAGYTFFLSSLIDHHLNMHSFGTILERPTNPLNSYILSVIALLVLLTACLNFMNLTIGNSSCRLKEIGIRKALGAFREQIAKQFWFEALLLSILALIVGFALAELFLPTFNSLSGKLLNIDYSEDMSTLFFLIGLTLCVALVAGSYPAFIFSGFDAIDILRNKLKIGGRNLLTMSLITMQFVFSISLVCATIIIKLQQSFISNMDLGYNKADMVIVPLFSSESNPQKTEITVNSFKNELIHYKDILSISGSSRSLGDALSGYGFHDKDGKILEMSAMKVDYDFVKTMGIKIIEGRNFSPEFSADLANSIIVNQTFVNLLSISEPIGKNPFEILKLKGMVYFKNYTNIIGVMKDFNSMPLRYNIMPVFLSLNPQEPYRYINIKIRNANTQETLKIIKEQFQKIAPDQPYSYTFLDDDLAKKYEQEARWSKIVTIASIFAILIACSGLFGLTLLTVVRRTKEIGIRKVLGSSVSDIVYLLIKEFGLLIVVSNIIAWPIAYYAMNRWLQTFAYRIHLTPFPFLLAGTIALLIALATVSFQAIKAARANPVEALRYE